MSSKQALLESIEHWHENLDMLILNHLSNNDLIWQDIWILEDDCSLCQEDDSNCKECIIGDHCENTPWEIVDSYFYDEFDYKIIYKAISDELEFLYGLLEKI